MHKRLLDITVASVALLVVAPVPLIAVLALKLSSPRAHAFFVQERTGYGGRRFRLYKLRTMVPDAESLKSGLAHLNGRSWPDFKIGHDPRITRIGRILRATSVDELPQLFNVLRGDMSLVGPRPTSIGPDGYEQWQCERFEVKPGLTGLCQVSARDSSSFDQRVTRRSSRVPGPVRSPMVSNLESRAVPRSSRCVVGRQISRQRRA